VAMGVLRESAEEVEIRRVLFANDKETDEHGESAKERNPHHPLIGLNPRLHSRHTLEHDANRRCGKELHKENPAH